MSVYYSALVFCRSSPQMEKRGILANFDVRDLVLESLSCGSESLEEPWDDRETPRREVEEEHQWDRVVQCSGFTDNLQCI